MWSIEPSPRIGIGQYSLLFPLQFVRCDVCCCGAVAPRVTAALLGRFFPRLGPLATASGPFFCVRLRLHAPAPPRMVDHRACTDEARRMLHPTILRSRMRKRPASD